MPRGTIYNPDSGEILCCLDIGEKASFDLNMEGRHYIDGFYNSEDYYVLDGEAVARPDMPVSLEGCKIVNIPENSLVIVADSTRLDYPSHNSDSKYDGKAYEVTDGELELDTQYPGEYRVMIKAFPYKDWEGVITIEGDL